MKKISTVATKQSRNFSQQKLTIGLDLGDRSSWYCLLDEVGEVLLEQKLSTTPKAMKEVFGAMPHSRIAVETGMHSPWGSRLLSERGHEVIVAHARNVRLIGESRKKDDRLDARTLARLARIDPELLCPVKHRSAKAQADLTVIRARGTGALTDGADQHGAGTDQVLRGAVAGLQSAKPESGESPGAEPGVASGAGAVAGGHRIAQRADLRIPPADR
jgi:transposase